MVDGSYSQEGMCVVWGLLQRRTQNPTCLDPSYCTIDIREDCVPLRVFFSGEELTPQGTCNPVIRRTSEETREEKSVLNHAGDCPGDWGLELCVFRTDSKPVSENHMTHFLGRCCKQRPPSYSHIKHTYPLTQSPISGNLAYATIAPVHKDVCTEDVYYKIPVAKKN